MRQDKTVWTGLSLVGTRQVNFLAACLLLPLFYLPLLPRLCLLSLSPSLYIPLLLCLPPITTSFYLPTYLYLLLCLPPSLPLPIPMQHATTLPPHIPPHPLFSTTSIHTPPHPPLSHLFVFCARARARTHAHACCIALLHFCLHFLTCYPFHFLPVFLLLHCAIHTFTLPTTHISGMVWEDKRQFW